MKIIMNVRRKIVLTAVITFLVTAILLSLIFSSFISRADIVRLIIERKYAGNIDRDKIENYSAKAAVAALGDQHSGYMTPDEYNSLYSEISGSYQGIGVEVFTNEQQQLEIATVFADTPASNAGLKVGDVIKAVDNIEAEYDAFSDVINYLRGISEAGKSAETMTLKIIRGDEELQIEISRDDVSIQSVFTNEIDDLLYIRISSFAIDTANEFKAALENTNSDAYNGLIIDVRDNPGGYLTTVVRICDMLLPEATIVYTSDKNGKTKYYYSDSATILKPIVVLINENSASASEILSGALHDNGAATLVGKKTFGKGSVQEVIPFWDNSALRLTTAHYYTPSGVCIDGIGIEPDYEVFLADENQSKSPSLLLPEQDTQLQKAVELLKR